MPDKSNDNSQNHTKYDGSQFKFLVLSRSEAKRIAPGEPYIVVSVTNPKLPVAELAPSPLQRAALRLQFDDVEDGEETFGKKVRMTGQDADAILDFVEKHKADVSTIVCHCEAGMSRSVGIAAALSKILQGEEKFFFAKFKPNAWVYRLLLKAQAERA